LADTPASVQKPAAAVAQPQTAPILSVTRAGSRIVAVGDHGVVLLSDDEGKSFRQAKAVPTQAVLTSVSFVGAEQGWAVGHDGVIIHSADGGETWSLQREDEDGDKPLFSVRFADAQHGLAVGLFNVSLRTGDGGKTWTRFDLKPGGDEDKHLYSIFGAGQDLYIAAEAGMVYRSHDGGATWAEAQTSNIGSFWTGALLKDGSVLVAGQRGHIFESHDHGASWAEVRSGTDQSLTGVAQKADGGLLLTGLAGTTLQSADGGKTFIGLARADRMPLTALTLAQDGTPVLFGGSGVVNPEP
jgi:photosystem II stability/assembly factor-like uncharacterized protein